MTIRSFVLGALWLVIYVTAIPFRLIIEPFYYPQLSVGAVWGDIFDEAKVLLFRRDA